VWGVYFYDQDGDQVAWYNPHGRLNKTIPEYRLDPSMQLIGIYGTLGKGK